MSDLDVVLMGGGWDTGGYPIDHGWRKVHGPASCEEYASAAGRGRDMGYTPAYQIRKVSATW